MAIKSASALFFALFLFVGSALSIFAAFKTNFPNANALNGEFTKQYETEFDKELAHRPMSINLLNAINFALFKEGRKGVLIGADDWLFTDEEFLLSDDYQINIDAHKNYISSVKNELDAKNIKLFVVPIPAKARLFQDQLGRHEYPTAWKDHYSSLLNFLNEEKISHNIDLEIIMLKSNSFLKNDTHWAPEGARSVAFNTALHIERKFPYLSWRTEKFISEKSETIQHKGDLTRYTMNKTEPLNQWQTISTKEEDLFTDKKYPVVLIGTSYSANPLWNFNGFLKEALGTDILNMADEGLGPFQVMKNYLDSATYKNDKPKLIIWEIPERYLPMKSKV